MLQIENIRLELEEDETLLPAKAAALLRIPEEELTGLEIYRRALDAREGVRFEIGRAHV